jgi:hypothetical protein
LRSRTPGVYLRMSSAASERGAGAAKRRIHSDLQARSYEPRGCRFRVGFDYPIISNVGSDLTIVQSAPVWSSDVTSTKRVWGSLNVASYGPLFSSPVFPVQLLLGTFDDSEGASNSEGRRGASTQTPNGTWEQL